jgi:uncharacterized protein (DUF433 family)
MFGSGLYTLPDVARYTGVPRSTIRSWFRPRSDGQGRGPMFQSDYETVDGEMAVSFLNLIDAYVARYFRQQNVSPLVLRRAHEILQLELGTPHPFAHADLCAGQGRIIRRTVEIADSPPKLVDVVSKQKWFSEMQAWLSRIDYARVTKLASRWNIADGVVIDPTVCFGQPAVRRTAVSTFVLANQFHANRRNAALVADLYSVREEDVRHAAAFEARHRQRIAA